MKLISLAMILSFCILANITANAATEENMSRSNLVMATQPEKVYSTPTKPIMVTKDKPDFIIQLPSNPTTGYSWFVKNFDRNILTLEKQTFVAPKPTIPGKGGVAKWFFKVNPSAFNGAYVTHIDLIYKRPWESKGGKVVSITVVTSHQ